MGFYYSSTCNIVYSQALKIFYINILSIVIWLNQDFLHRNVARNFFWMTFFYSNGNPNASTKVIATKNNSVKTTNTIKSMDFSFKTTNTNWHMDDTRNECHFREM